LKPKYYLDPFGCAKNQVDAESMMAYLNRAGWSSADNAADANLVIVNSCGFIESAKQESINAVLGWHKQYPGKKILLAGCLAQRYEKELSAALPEADGFLGNDNISKIVDAANKLSGTKPLSTKKDNLTVISPSSRPLLSLPGSAYVKISEGCNNCCAYCAIPLIRGPLRCRTIPDIIEECRGLLARNVKELCIIGQDIGSYSSGDFGLPQLLAAIAKLPGSFWVRLLYIHPDNFPLSALEIIKQDHRFLPYFDIPFQHASQKILSAMNRRGTAKDYLSLVETIRNTIPAAVIRTTFLAGFPGETDTDFVSLLDFQEKLRPDWSGCFTYSREEGTPAYAMKGQVSKKIAAQRQREIEKRQIQITEKKMAHFVGQKYNVLLEESFYGSVKSALSCTESNEVLWLGRLYCHAPEVDGAAVVTAIAQGIEPKAGELLPCRVIASRGFDLQVAIIN
jgi:ribosomal protein S12 methylthiotransferase